METSFWALFFTILLALIVFQVVQYTIIKYYVSRLFENWKISFARDEEKEARDE